MMSPRRLSMLLALSVLLVACGTVSPWSSDGQRQAGTPPPAPSATDVVERSDWRLAEPAQGRQLQVLVPIPSAASCGSFDRVDMSESADRVSVEIFVRRLVPGEGAACTDDLAFQVVTLDLEQDLGERQLEGCDAPPEGSQYFDDPLPPEGCIGAVAHH